MILCDYLPAFHCWFFISDYCFSHPPQGGLPDSVIILQLKHKFWIHNLYMVYLHL